MATQKTINITADWQSLNTLTGASVGTQIDAQVSRGRGIRVAGSDSKPDENLHGFHFEVGAFFRSETGAKECWVRASVDGDLGQLEVEY